MALLLLSHNVLSEPTDFKLIIILMGSLIHRVSNSFCVKCIHLQVPRKTKVIFGSG